MRVHHIATVQYASGKMVILAFCVTAIVLLGACVTAAAFCASGSVDAGVYWSVSSGFVHMSQEIKCVDEEFSIYLSEELTGPDGNMGGAQSIASLPAAWQSAYGSGITPDADAGAASGYANSALKDRLIVTVPAGTYDQDVEIGLRGRVSGTFTTTHGGSGRATYGACFGSANCVQLEWEDEDGWAFSRNYYLFRCLVTAGTTLMEPRVWTINFGSDLTISGQSYGGGINSGYSEISAALHIRSSQDIGWTSDSGAFGSEALSQADNDFDGDVDGSDLAEFIGDFNRNDCTGDCDGDFDFDGRVDNADLLAFAADFGMAD
jgi:hypothetical protein